MLATCHAILAPCQRPFDLLCRSIGLGPDTFVALMDLAFYGDAGGNSDRSNVAVGGYIASVEQWSAFTEPWQDALDAEDVECFHRAEMEPPFHGCFKEKGWTVRHQVAVLKKFHGIIKRSTQRGVGYAVRNRAFAELMPPKIKHEYGGPYGWCVLLTLVEVGLWARRRNQWVTYFFEAGDFGQRKADAVIRRLYNDGRYRELFRILGWGFYPKKGPHAVIQLQPADFIAFEAYKDIDNFLAGSPRPARMSRKNLIRPGSDELRFWTDTALAKWLARYADFKGNVIETLITDNP
jgi:hypothetical protein